LWSNSPHFLNSWNQSRLCGVSIPFWPRAGRVNPDATDEYVAVGHSRKSNEIALQYHIGQLEGADVQPWSVSANGDSSSSGASGGSSFLLMLPLLIILVAIVYKFAL
jgi:hypothetical protein